MKPYYERLLELVTQARSVDDLRTALHTVISNYDLEKFTYQIVQNEALHNFKNYYLTTFPNEWEKRYLSQNYFDADPLVNRYKTSGSSFVWQNEQESDQKEKTKKMFSEAAQYNLHHGVGIPLPGPNNSFSILTLCSENSDEKEVQKIHDNFEKDLMICGWMFHSAMMSLNLDGNLFQTFDLTNKEIECLKWICAGKSNNDIGCILGVSEHTIKARVSNMLKKMGCYTRLDLILKAKKYKVADL